MRIIWLPMSLLALPLAAQAGTHADISARDLRTRVEILAADSMEGRGTGAPGLERATRYVEQELERLSLRPAGRSGFRFPVEVERMSARVEASMVGGGAPTRLSRDALVLLSGVGGPAAEARLGGRGALVYGGFMDASDDASQPVAEERLRDAVLIIWMGREEADAPRYNLARLTGRYSPLEALILVVEDTAEWSHLSDRALRGAIVPRRGPAAAGDGPPVFAIEASAARRLWGAPAEMARGGPLGEFLYEAEVVRAPLHASNLVAVVPGRDSVLAEEFVLLSAHLDHAGMGAAVDGDSVYNGADDDASGSAALLEVAERLANDPDGRARSVMLVWHTAEEEGLLGSRAFAERPTVPRERVVAVLNLDMVARNHPDTIAVIGSRRLSSALDRALVAANQKLGTPFVLDYSLDAEDHPERLYCRSDHVSYARYGIPVAYLTGGLHPDYHRPTDEAGALDYSKLERVAELVLVLTQDLAAAARRPAVDRPLPPLGAACR